MWSSVLNIIIDKLSYSRFVYFIDNNNILFPKQYGFRKNIGNTDADIEYVHCT